MASDSRLTVTMEIIETVMDVAKIVLSRKDSIAKVDHLSNLVHAFHISLTEVTSQQLVQFTSSEGLSKASD